AKIQGDYASTPNEQPVRYNIAIDKMTAPQPPEKRALIGTDITYEQWLEYMKSPSKDVLFEDYMFPTDVIREQFVEEVHGLPENEVRHILRKFLDFGGILGSDQMALERLSDLLKTDRSAAIKLIEE